MRKYEYKKTFSSWCSQAGLSEVNRILGKDKSYLLKTRFFLSKLISRFIAYQKFNLQEQDGQLVGEILLKNGVWTKIRIDLKYNTPKVFCDAFWVRRHPDWHTYYKYNELCWVYPKEWLFYTKKWIIEEQSAQTVINHMTDLLYRNVEYLLNIHYIAFENSIENWLPEWGGYPHGNEAAKKQLLQKISIQDIIYLS